MKDSIIIKGARENNLKNVNLTIPKNKLVVFSGISGSGKSSMAMDTIYAEGQRRYVESLSSYARQFLGNIKKPDVDSIEGLSPSIAIYQKTVSHNPRSTVGTITEIYDYLRLLFSRIGIAHCPSCGDELKPQSIDEIVDSLVSGIKNYIGKDGNKVVNLSVWGIPVSDKKGEYDSLFKILKKQGWGTIIIDNHFFELSEKLPPLEKYKKHTIEVRMDFLQVSLFDMNEGLKEFRTRLFSAVEQALKIEPSFVRIRAPEVLHDKNDTPVGISSTGIYEDFSTSKTCRKCGISLPDFEPKHFSFNSPHGACPVCNGLGNIRKVDPGKVIDPSLSLLEGGIIPYAKTMSSDGWNKMIITEVCRKHGIPLSFAISKIPKEYLDLLLYGTGNELYTIKYYSKYGGTRTATDIKFEGIIPNLERRYIETNSEYIRNEISKYMTSVSCTECGGTRLKAETRAVTVDGLNISEITDMSIRDFALRIDSLIKSLDRSDKVIAEVILREIKYRTLFLMEVGLEYLTVSRSADTLSGGESQRIRLASQIGTGLTGVIYVLDEPSIGLHSRDQNRLIGTLKRLRDLGNSVIVVEHDKDTMLNADMIVDFGVGAGERGGEVIAQGNYTDLMNNKSSVSGPYLGAGSVVYKNVNSVLNKRFDGYTGFEHGSGDVITIDNISTNNLKNVNLSIKLGRFVCVTGVSGSGKSSLITETLYPVLQRKLGYVDYDSSPVYGAVNGYEKIDRVVFVDQSPIGRTPRSNPATYTKVFDPIREIFALTKQAKIKGYNKSKFSFNLKGGRCESCKGEGKIKIEMQFMPDIYVDCDVCNGNRYVTEVLDIMFKGKNIVDVLNMSVEEAYSFFNFHPVIKEKLSLMIEVGLGYMKLGQPAPLLSGGEAQRVKLASELDRKSYGRTMYILDEPTTGLHFMDMEKLLVVIKGLVHRGDTVVAIEHNLDFISMADWIIDVGPEGGDKGGNIIFEGTVDEIIENDKSWTGKFLRRVVKER
ncbi:MAG TPA: excinuclease ABC subunit UvrA [Candidatus Dojkabacteria bacterium]|nr:excinuclease ABC subunit UvrA [Candidatus Dojkabacteria bacterium]